MLVQKFKFKFKNSSPVGLQLRRNRHLIAPSFKIVLRGGDSNPGQEPEQAESRRLDVGVPRCHFLHRDDATADSAQGMVAALSLCQPRSVVGDEAGVTGSNVSNNFSSPV